MSKIFKPKIVMPPVPPAPEPVRFEPVKKMEKVDKVDADTDPQDAINEDGSEAAIKKKNTKRAKTILTSPQGLTTEADTFNTTLMS